MESFDGRDPRHRISLPLLLAAFVFVLMVWPALVAWPFPRSVNWLGLGVAVAGIVLVAVAQHQMGASFRIGIDDEETALVKGGLFAVVRNPIFTGLVVLLTGMFAAVPCGWSLGLWIVTAVVVSRQTRLEERHLLVQHGVGYRSYASRVGRFVPGSGRLARSAAAAGGR